MEDMPVEIKTYPPGVTEEVREGWGFKRTDDKGDTEVFANDGFAGVLRSDGTTAIIPHGVHPGAAKDLSDALATAHKNLKADSH